MFSNFSVECPWQESNPWGSVLRVICVTIKCAIAQPRLCDCLMVAQITLLTSDPLEIMTRMGSSGRWEVTVLSRHGGA